MYFDVCTLLLYKEKKRFGLKGCVHVECCRGRSLCVCSERSFLWYDTTSFPHAASKQVDELHFKLTSALAQVDALQSLSSDLEEKYAALWPVNLIVDSVDFGWRRNSFQFAVCTTSRSVRRVFLFPIE
jgi:hypothetical protein